MTAHYGGSYVGSHITCLACGGKGYQVTRDYMNIPRPVKCRGCEGTGRQRVAA